MDAETAQKLKQIENLLDKLTAKTRHADGHPSASSNTTETTKEEPMGKKSTKNRAANAEAKPQAPSAPPLRNRPRVGLGPRVIPHYDPFNMDVPEDKVEAVFWARRHPAMRSARSALLRAQGEADLVYDVLVEVYKEEEDARDKTFPDEGELGDRDGLEKAEVERLHEIETTRSHVKRSVLEFDVPHLQSTAHQGPPPFLLGIEDIKEVLAEMTADAFGCIDPIALVQALKQAEHLHKKGEKRAPRRSGDVVFPDEGKMGTPEKDDETEWDETEWPDE